MKRVFGLFVIIIILLLSACKKEEAPSYTVQLLPGNDTVYVGQDWEDGGCAVIVEGETYQMQRENDPNTNRANEYLIKYSYEYLDYYEVTCLRMVKVIRNEFPVVTLNPGVDTIKVNTEHIDMGISYDDDITGSLFVDVTSNVDVTVPGVYNIKYKVTDMDRHQTIVTRVVTVIE